MFADDHLGKCQPQVAGASASKTGGGAVAEIMAACLNGAGEELTIPDLVRWGVPAFSGKVGPSRFAWLRFVCFIVFRHGVNRCGIVGIGAIVAVRCKWYWIPSVMWMSLQERLFRRKESCSHVTQEGLKMVGQR